MITVREMIPGDLPRLEQIYLESRISAFYWIDPTSFNLSDFSKDTEGEWVLVAECEGKPVGFSAIWVKDNFLHHLFIDPNFQRQGIGRRLLDACFAGKLQKPARLKAVVQNARACAFYETLGWEIESTTPDGPMGPYHTYVFK